jgi:hypothetical protein
MTLTAIPAQKMQRSLQHEATLQFLFTRAEQWCLVALGVWSPIDRLDAAMIKRLLRTVEDLGYSTF